ncbi:unnamed protein product [Lactuca virosa]|uniref:Uncharacterized protein n=1 Tax=Lactuca virosa TaxID=75947 RepID=A0AAU9MSS0_9ASTR|nr:unnamed protein product [Lactuca virosa]
MDNSKDQGSKIANTDENPSSNTQSPVDSSLIPAVAVENGNPNRPSAAPRTPFTNLSQVDADLASLVEFEGKGIYDVEMNGDGSDHESWETGSYVHDDDDDEFDHHNSEYEGSEANEEEEDAFDVHAHLDLGSGEEDRSNHGVELDPASFPDDESYARALQDAEDQDGC